MTTPTWTAEALLDALRNPPLVKETVVTVFAAQCRDPLSRLAYLPRDITIWTIQQQYLLNGPVKVDKFLFPALQVWSRHWLPSSAFAVVSDRQNNVYWLDGNHCYGRVAGQRRIFYTAGRPFRRVDDRLLVSQDGTIVIMMRDTRGPSQCITLDGRAVDYQLYSSDSETGLHLELASEDMPMGFRYRILSDGLVTLNRGCTTEWQEKEYILYCPSYRGSHIEIHDRTRYWQTKTISLPFGIIYVDYVMVDASNLIMLVTSSESGEPIYLLSIGLADVFGPERMVTPVATRLAVGTLLRTAYVEGKLILCRRAGREEEWITY